jgi:hypothetical protein
MRLGYGIRLDIARPAGAEMAFPFPNPFPNLLGSDAKLTAALATAMSEARARFPALRTAIAIVAVDETVTPNTFSVAGDGHRDTHYSASLLKVAAMYAAFELRDTVRIVAEQDDTATTPAEVFSHLASHDLNGTITSAVPRIPSDQRKAPEYQSIFVAIPTVDGTFAVDFNGDFNTQMRAMIVNGSNEAAAQCIKRLGYSWINGALGAGGFFNSANQGIWLAGTFTGLLPAVRVDSVNDGPVAQATTCVDLANLYALMIGGLLVDPFSSEDMLNLLAAGATGPEPAWITRRGIVSPGFGLKVTHTKIGLGTLKRQNGGFDVFSEGSILEHRASGRRFITIWQNTNIQSQRQIPLIIDKTVSTLLASP